jgi:hypothetical protein
MSKYALNVFQIFYLTILKVEDPPESTLKGSDNGILHFV